MQGQTADKPLRKAKLSRALTFKQQAFVSEYMANGFNGCRAAEAAGYRGDRRTLDVTAHRNLKNSQLAARCRAQIEGRAADADEVLALLGDHCSASVGLFVDCWLPDGDLDLRKAQELGIAHLIKKFKRARRAVQGKDGPTGEYEYAVEIELHDAQAAASKLLPVLGLKQRPNENERETTRKREVAQQAIARLEAQGMERAEALVWLRAEWPEAAKMIQ